LEPVVCGVEVAGWELGVALHPLLQPVLQGLAAQQLVAQQVVAQPQAGCEFRQHRRPANAFSEQNVIPTTANAASRIDLVMVHPLNRDLSHERAF
jgi:hypothetical protein